MAHPLLNLQRRQIYLKESVYRLQEALLRTLGANLNWLSAADRGAAQRQRLLAAD